MQSMWLDLLIRLLNNFWKLVVAAALLIMVVLAVGIPLGWWSWKTLIGWNALIDYINPRGSTQKREALQVYAVFVAGVIASITAAVGLANLRLTRKNLEQQRELEASRAQSTALQAYYEQIGMLLTEKKLRTTEEEDVRELARAQTLTLLRELDADRKGSLLTFLYSAGLIQTGTPPVRLDSADWRGANLEGADLRNANLGEANLGGANLQSATLWNANLAAANLEGADLWSAQLLNANLWGAQLQGADLRNANLRNTNLMDTDLEGATLWNANLEGANLQYAEIDKSQLEQVRHLEGATMPDGTKHD